MVEGSVGYLKMNRLVLGILIYMSLGILKTVKAISAQDYISKVGNGGLKCYVCNSAFEYCGNDENFLETVGSIKTCDIEYFKKMYGVDSLNTNDLNQWPQALSELANGPNPPRELGVGYAYNTFPSSYIYSISSPAIPHPFKYRFSSAQMSFRSNPDQKMSSCFKMTIQTTEQRNGGFGREIVKDPEGVEKVISADKKTGQRVIRGCSLVNPDDLDSSLYKEGGNLCRLFNQGKKGTGQIRICYSKGNLSNDATYIRLSQGAILATTSLVLVWRWILGA